MTSVLRRPSSSRGITLLELGIALALAALICSLAVPAFSRLSGDAQLVSASHQLVGALHFARSHAISKGIPTVLCVSENTRECLASGRRARGWLVIAGSEENSKVLRAHRLDSRIDLRATRARVTYWPVSRMGSTSTFELCHRDFALPTRAVIVSRTGRPRSAERSLENSACAR